MESDIPNSVVTYIMSFARPPAPITNMINYAVVESHRFADTSNNVKVGERN